MRRAGRGSRLQVGLVNGNELFGEQHPAGPLVQCPAGQLVGLSDVGNLGHASRRRLGMVGLESAVELGMILQRLAVGRLGDGHSA